uniref:sulfite oxidase n=1 Tax=Globodera rostochiensis TaxID=31243 RepID=A0A914HES0_GLORO
MKYFTKHSELLRILRLATSKNISSYGYTKVLETRWTNAVVKRFVYMAIAGGSLGFAFHQFKRGTTSGGIIAQFYGPANAERIWVTFKQGVYDITDFIALHPGGDKILLAAGASIEPFWAVYAQHETEEVTLEEQRKKVPSDDPFAADPPRHPALIVNMQKPFNAESPPDLLTESFLTPNQLFFVRNHMSVPETHEQTHCVRIDGIGVDKQIVLSVDDLRNKFEPVTIISAIQCAGNRRYDMNQSKKVQGLMWTGTAISNAKWKGCRLRDVLIAAGVKPNDKRIKHVQFEGADVDTSGAHYGASIPFEKAMNPEVVLAFEMNDEALTRDHGFPIRLIVPGNVGARQVKWLNGIRLSDEESFSNWQRRDYKAFPNSVQIGDPLPFDTTPSIQEYPVQSAICVPNANSKISPDAKTVTIRGYAWSGGGRGIIRVEVSSDSGTTWKCAELEQCSEQDLEHMWAWTLWSVELPIPEAAIEKARNRGRTLECPRIIAQRMAQSYSACGMNKSAERGRKLIEDRLYLYCTIENAPQFLIDAKIGRVLTVAVDHIGQRRRLPGVEYRHIRMSDIETEELLASQKLLWALTYIEDSVNNGINIVVHCQCGISRSATVVVAYLMRKHSWSVHEALTYVQKRRSIVQPNPSFMRQLEIFEQLGYRCDSSFLRQSKLFKEFQSVTNNPLNVSIDGDVYTLNESAKYSVGGKRFSCKKCRSDLFFDFNVLTHKIDNKRNVGKCGLIYLITPMEWMELNEHSGKLICFKCHKKIGHYNWSGKECLFQFNGNGCGAYITPWIHVHAAKIDSFEMKIIP